MGLRQTDNFFMRSLAGGIAIALGVALLAIGVRWFVYARSESASNACVNNLRLIASAKDQWALEQHKTTNDEPTWKELLPYVGYGPKNLLPRCPSGGIYTIGRIGEPPKCSIGGRNHSLPDVK